MNIKTAKPLGHKSYGSIPHLPGSRRGLGDHGISEQQARICTIEARDSLDVIIVQEKLDGTNVSVAKINGEIVPLVRAGYVANTSPFEQHHLFYDWALRNSSRFEAVLNEGERICGEWLAQAHGTRYQLTHEPFVAFDIMRGHERECWQAVEHRLLHFKTAATLSAGSPMGIDQAMKLSDIAARSRGAIDPSEGAVWRVERNRKVDFLAKYVRTEKVDGIYLPEKNGGTHYWNWRPA